MTENVPFTLNVSAPTLAGLTELIGRASAGFLRQTTSELAPMSSAKLQEVLGVRAASGDKPEFIFPLRRTQGETVVERVSADVVPEKDSYPVRTSSEIAEQDYIPGVKDRNGDHEETLEEPNGPSDQTDDAPAKKRHRRTKAEIAAERALLDTAARLAALRTSETTADEPELPLGLVVAATQPEVLSAVADPALLEIVSEPVDVPFEDVVEPYAVVNPDGEVHELLPTPAAWAELLTSLFNEAHTHDHLLSLAKANNASGVIARLKDEGYFEDLIKPLQELVSARLAALKITPTALTESVETTPEPVGIALEDIRAAIAAFVAKKDAQQALKFLQGEFGIKRAPDLPTERYAEFLEKIAKATAE